LSVRFRSVLSFALLAVAACGSHEEPEENAADIANIVENIAEVPEPVAEKEAAAPALQPLTQTEIEANLEPGAGCDFSAGASSLFVSTGTSGVAKVNGRVVRFTAGGPTGPSGGFYSAGTLRLSIGRTSEAGAAEGETTSWAGRLSLSDRATDARPLEVGGTWRCGA